MTKEESFMLYQGLTKSEKEVGIQALVGDDGKSDFPYPELLKNLTMYNLNDKPYMVVAQPSKADVIITDEMQNHLIEWADKRDLIVDVNCLPSYYGDQYHFIEIGIRQSYIT